MLFADKAHIGARVFEILGYGFFSEQKQKEYEADRKEKLFHNLIF
jgi:hypothetical protein